MPPSGPILYQGLVVPANGQEHMEQSPTRKKEGLPRVYLTGQVQFGIIGACGGSKAIAEGQGLGGV